MLVPAVLYKEQITKEFQKLYYTEDMLFETGCLEQWRPEIEDIPSAGRFDYAIVSGNKLIGFLSYQVDYYCSSAYNFGLMSFDRGNPIIGKDVFEKLEELVSTLHRVEWRMIGGNPAERDMMLSAKDTMGINIFLRIPSETLKAIIGMILCMKL